MFCLGIVLYRTRPLAFTTSSTVLSAIQFASGAAILLFMHSGWNDALLVVPFALLIFSTQTDKGIASLSIVFGYTGRCRAHVILEPVPARK